MGKAPRFYVHPECVRDSGIALPDTVVRHAVRTLRMTTGDSLVLFDGSGTEYAAKLTRLNDNSYAAIVESAYQGLRLPEPRIALYQSPVKKERWEWLVEKATEIGVRAIIPLMTRFTEVDVTEKFEKKLERWKLIVQSACEQSGRSVLTRLDQPVSFEKAVSEAAGEKLLFHEGEADSFRDRIPALPPHGEVSVFVGPEGGFTKEEVELARSSGIHIVSLGKQILRGETAGIVAAALFSFALPLRLPDAEQVKSL